MVVRIWVVEAEPAEADARSLLTPAELSRAGELAREQVRRTFVVSRAVQRALGARYLGVPAAEVGISRACAHCAHDTHGKPHFTAAPELDFSVSHTGDLVVIAAATDTRVGLDVELGNRMIEVDEMTRVLTTAGERRILAGHRGEALRTELFRIWARKEAAVKLTGHGLLQVPFTALSVDGPVVRIDTPPAGWPDEAVHLTDLPLGHGSVAALATTVAGPRTEIVTLPRVADLTL
ncbi:4'-phosphopantetheinyl transferase superfamily protein [Streptomyces sp. HUAS MG91]|uniref:4'-phosphopantetheinyl transferase superfamily protein n=1 Tax=Streptomyces tabacisoli TaxID=3156398 RepID=A0AAU8IRK8_9ACTN